MMKGEQGLGKGEKCVSTERMEDHVCTLPIHIPEGYLAIEGCHSEL